MSNRIPALIFLSLRHIITKLQDMLEISVVNTRKNMLFASFCEKDLKFMWYVRCYAKENCGNDPLKSPSMNNFCSVCWCNFKTSYGNFNRQVLTENLFTVKQENQQTLLFTNV